MSYCRAIIMGHLGKNPELKTTQSGKEVCKFSLATNRGSGEHKSVQWHSVVAFGKTAEVCAKYLAKGSKVLIEGEITYRDWEDKNGVKRTATEIIANNVQFVGARDQSRGLATPKTDFAQADETEIPF